MYTAIAGNPAPHLRGLAKAVPGQVPCGTDCSQAVVQSLNLSLTTVSRSSRSTGGLWTVKPLYSISEKTPLACIKLLSKRCSKRRTDHTHSQRTSVTRPAFQVGQALIRRSRWRQARYVSGIAKNNRSRFLTDPNFGHSPGVCCSVCCSGGYRAVAAGVPVVPHQSTFGAAANWSTHQGRRPSGLFDIHRHSLKRGHSRSRSLTRHELATFHGQSYAAVPVRCVSVWAS